MQSYQSRFCHSVDLGTIQEELQTIAKLCYVYQNGLGRRVRYPKNLNMLVEEGLANTDKSKKLLAKYEYLYTQMNPFKDHENQYQYVLIYPKKKLRKIPVILINYTSKKEALLTQKKLKEIKNLAIAATEKHSK